MIKRLFDFVMSLFGLFILSPILVVLSVAIVISSGFPIFFTQVRIGKKERPFLLMKFRTMRKGASGLQITADKDPRITKIGDFLRKYKLDELPQLLNILLGQMSFVGPRPEVKKYVDMYTSDEKQILRVKPGLTGLDSLNFSDESKLLKASENPERTYINDILPQKIKLNLEYIQNMSFTTDLKIILATIIKVFS